MGSTAHRCSAYVCVMQEGRVICFPVTASDPENQESLLDNRPSVYRWVDRGGCHQEITVSHNLASEQVEMAAVNSCF